MDKREQLEQQNARLREQNEKLVEEAKSLAADLEQLKKEKHELSEKLLQSQNELEAMIRRLFGRKSERFEDEDQLTFEFAGQDEIDDAREGIEQAVEENAPKPKPGRRRRKRSEIFPESLERKEVVIDLPEDEKEGLVRIGEDIQETAHYRRPIVYILRKVFPKYAQAGQPDAGIKQAERPPALVAGNRYDTSFAAEIIAAKCSYHLPIYRQEDLFAGCGIQLSRSTLLNLQQAAAEVLRPLAQYFADFARTDYCLGSDDTGVRLLLPKDVPTVSDDDPKSGRVAEVIGSALAENKKSIFAKMWAYRGTSAAVNVFDFTVSRHRDGPDLFLIDKDYRGVLLGDCYGANTGIYIRSNGLVVHAACVAHARRKAEYALDNHAEHAKFMLRCFGDLYDIEDEARYLTAEGRFDLRQDRSLPIWNRLRDYLENDMSRVSSKEKIGEARSYLLNQWDALTAHLSDGRIPIDNNECEQLMKQVALGRKNWLFCGSVSAGYRSADLMTICSSAIRNDLDVFAYVKDALDQLVAGSTDYESLRPDVWAKSHPESVRDYRIVEKRQRSARRDRQRLERRLAKLSR
jgi:transposase